MSSKNKSDSDEINDKKDVSENKKNKKCNKKIKKKKSLKFKNITIENISKLKDYKANNLDDSEDKWKTYLYEGIKGELRKRLDEIISKSEYNQFFEGLKYEYGYGVEK